MMKKNLLSLLLAAFSVVSFSSCSDDSEEELSATVGLIGTWTLQSADILINDKSMEQFITELATLMGVPEESIAEEFEMDGFESGTSLEFKEDGTYVLTEVGEDTPETGLWSATDKTVTIRDAAGNDPLILDVRSLTKSKAVFYMLEEETDGEMSMKMEITMNFTK